MISFTLKGKSKADVGLSPSLRRPSSFLNVDDEPTSAGESSKAPSRPASEVNRRIAVTNSLISKAQKRRIDEAQKVDKSVYEYDEVYDRMQEAKVKAKEAKEADTKNRQPKYIKNLLMTAETRRLDHLRAEEKMIQREREAEGDEFAGRDQFVTQAYKDQVAALRKAEEEEKEREAKATLENKSSGMTHFYRQLLQQSEEQHTATMTVMEELSSLKQHDVSQGPNLTIMRPPTMPLKSDKQLAAEASTSGKSIELNDDNQIVDRRDLLAAGLNLSAPNTRKVGLHLGKRRTQAPENDIQIHTAVGTAASRREIQQRRNKEILDQLEEEQSRTQKEEERLAREEKEKATMKRNTEEQIVSARERYLQRKKRKLEEAEYVVDAG